MEILVVDVGGTNVKMRASVSDEVRRLASGPEMTPDEMTAKVREATTDWPHDVVALGYPGECRDGRPSLEPNHLGPGWVGFDFERAFGCPVRIINDAAMQALGGYRGGRMLFLGLGTGLGSAIVVENVVQQMELSQLPYRDGFTYGDMLRQSGLERIGLPAWRTEVGRIVQLLRAALVAEYVVVGGGNARLLESPPAHAVLGDNSDAFEGGFRLWRAPWVRF